MINADKNLQSLGIFVGTGYCNANCAHCAGLIHRKYAPKKDGIIDEKLLSKTLEDCYLNGARKLSITSSGEPTLSEKSVTKTLEMISTYAKNGMKYSQINIYSNGIRIGEDKKFCDKYLNYWNELGLTNVYITVHSIDSEKNAEIYGIKKYPALSTIVSRIHDANLKLRANIVLSKNIVSTLEEFKSLTNGLITIGFDYISAWPIKTMDDKIDYNNMPEDVQIQKIHEWIESNRKSSIIHLYDNKNKEAYEKGMKITLFADGTLSSTWCNN